MVTAEECQSAYNNYGVDLIRTGGLLVGSSPSSIFRACTIFQRFQRLVNRDFRAKYMSIEDVQALHKKEKELFESFSTQHAEKQEEMVDALLSTNGKVEFLIPEYVEEAHSRGTVRLGYIFAPIEYCLYHIIMQEDIVYIAAACLLIASKMEDQHVRIRPIVKTYARLTMRRCGLPIMPDFAQDEGQYESFKACVVEAEEIILHQLGFQTFVEAPFKYVAVYLNVLVSEPEGAKQAGAPSLLATWLTKAVQEVNDFPRCAALLDTSPSLLAVMALDRARPDSVSLPDNWAFAFGVTHEQLEATKTIYANYKKEQAVVSSKEQVDAIRKTMAGLPYRSKSQWAMVYYTLYRKDLVEKNEELYKTYGVGFFVRIHAPSPPPPPPAVTSPQQKPQVAGTPVDALAIPSAGGPADGGAASSQDKEPKERHSATTATSDEKKSAPSGGDLDGFNFEDIKSLMKRRRQEEKEEHKRQKRLKEEAQHKEKQEDKHSSHHHHGNKDGGKDRSADQPKEARGRDHGKESRDKEKSPQRGGARDKRERRDYRSGRDDVRERNRDRDRSRHDQDRRRDRERDHYRRR